MIKQNVDTLKLMKKFHAISEDLGCRFSMLDVICFLYIHEHEDCGIRDISEYIYSDREKRKSSLDAPLKRLCDTDLIKRTDNPNAITKLNEPRILLSLSKNGKSLLKSCSF